MFEVYKPLRNNLRKYELVEALIASHRFIQYLDFDIDLPPYLAPPRDLSKIGKMRMGLVQWEFEILIREIILNCSPKVGKKLNSWSEVADKINRIKSIENEVWGGSEDRQNDILYELVRIAHRQFPWQRGFSQEFLARYHWLYRQDGIREILLDEYGLNATQLFQIALAISGHFMKEMSFRLPLQNLINDAPAESVAGLLDRFTISVGDLRKSYENAAEYNINWAYTFNPLRQTPLVRLGDYLLCPIPSFLIRRVTSEIYFDLVRHEDKFSRHYGPAVQNLVGRTFEAQNCNDNLSILGEERFGKRGKEKDSIDWIVSDATGHVFVECKSARIKYRGISDLTDQGFIIGEFHRIRAFALQAYKTLALALAGEYPHWAPDSKPVFVMIVTLEDWQSFGIHIDKHVMEPLRNELKEAGIDPEITISCPLSMCPVHDLEFAAHVFSEATILDVLRQKSEGEYPQWAMATYLGQHYSEHADDFKTVTCTEEWSQIMPKGRSRPRGRI